MSLNISDVLRGVRETNDETTFGLRAISIEAAGVSEDDVRGFLAEWAAGALADMAVEPRPDAAIPGIRGSAIEWRRLSGTLYPVYVERLRVVPADVYGSAEPCALKPGAAGEWLLLADVLLADSPLHYKKHLPAWNQHFLKTRSERSATGGMAINVLDIPSASLRSGEVDLRPTALHALTKDGRACDRFQTAAQKAVANAFWQTYWATGALRAERGVVFPVAFLPIDRACPHEFDPPFRERYVSLRRRLFGRTSILSYVIESLTRDKALFFDRETLTWCVADHYDPRKATWPTTAADVALALSELGRTAWIDAYTGSNAELFAAFRDAEDAASAAGELPEPWGFNSNAQTRPKIHAAGPASDFLERLRVPSGGDPDRYVRVHRVVPYAGAATLGQIVKHRDELVACGKLEDIPGEILAATNSTFFLNFPEEYASVHSAMNDPVALLVENGKTRHLRTIRRAALVVTQDGRAVITTRAGNRLLSQVLVFEGEAATCTAADGAKKSHRANKYGPLFFGAVVVGDSLVETFEESASEVPMNGWITGDSEAFGGTIDPRGAVEAQLRLAGEPGDAAIRHALAVGPMLVENGEVIPFGQSKEDFLPLITDRMPEAEQTKNLARTEMPPAIMDCPQRGIPPTRFPHDWNRTRAPRTAIGTKPDGSVVLVVVDGRANLAHSVGATLAELAVIMQNLGCDAAMNMDGGGSSVMHVNDPAAASHKMKPEFMDGVVSYPSDLGGVERLLPVPLLVIKR